MSAAFEQWAADKSFMLRVSAGDGYVNAKEMAREVWQAAQKAMQGEVVGWQFQHEDTGRTMFVTHDEVAAFEELNPRWHKTIPLYTAPQPVYNWTPVDVDSRAIHSNPDAKAWADLFAKTFPNSGADEGTMHSWFANYGMVMHDHVKAEQVLVAYKE